MIGIASQAPAAWAFSGPGGEVSLARWDEFVAVSGVQATTRGDPGRRGGLRRLRHPGARVWLGRFQGRRPQRQGPAHAEQRSGLGRGALRRQAPALLRALDLQVRERRASGRRRRHHHPHHAFRRLSVPGRPVVLDGRAVRAPCRRRTAPPGLRLDDRRAPPSVSWRSAAGSSPRWSRARGRSRSGRCRSACAPASRSRTRPARSRPRTSRACCQARIPPSGTRSWSTPRITTTSASPPPTRRATRSTTARSTTPPVAPSCSPSRELSPLCRSHRDARSSSCSSPPRSRACSARSTTRRIRPSPPGGSPPTSTSTRRTSTAARAT